MVAIVIGVVVLLAIIIITTIIIMYSGGDDERILDNVCIKQNKFNKEFLIENKFDKLKLGDNYTDVELIAQSVVFRAHKLILAAHSKYLATMLYTYSQSLNDSDPDSILQFEMTQVDHSTLSTILEFFYGKSLPLAIFENENDYTQLLKTSDEFQLDGLKCEVSKHLSKKLNKKNVAKLILLAEQADAPFLMNVASTYLLDHLSEVRSTAEWKLAVKSNGHILANAIDFHGKLPENTTCVIECEPVTLRSKPIVDNLRRFFTIEYFANVKISVSNGNDEPHVFRVNKAVLAGQSAKFQEQFQNSTSIELNDVNGAAMREFLMYMYSGWIISLEHHAKELLYLSHMYQMQALRDKCEDLIIDQLSVANATNILDMLSRFESERLSQAVLDFILKNRREIVKTADWIKLKKNKPELLNKIFNKI